MLFVVIFMAVIAGINHYLWLRLVRDTRLSRPTAGVATAVLVLLAASVPLAMALWSAWSRAYAPRVNLVAFSWLGVSFYLLLLFVAWDAARVARWLYTRVRRSVAAGSGRAGVPQPAAARESAAKIEHDDQDDQVLSAQDPLGTGPTRAGAEITPDVQAVAPERSAAQSVQTRRVFVARTVAGGALLTAGGIGAFGARAALWDITTPETSVTLPRLPRALDGFSIALLTDVHIGPLLDGRFLRHLVEQTNRLRPDLIAIGGDLVDGSVAQIGEQVSELRKLRSKYGVFFVTGNHEYYSGVEAWVGFLERLGVRVLTNRTVRIGDRDGAGASFDLAGVPDYLAGRAGAEPPSIDAATRDRAPERELVVLAHQPVQVFQTAQAGPGLQLSGHTHGGQLFPFGVLTKMVQPYLAGLYRHADTDTQIYVSRGSGFWGPPMRVLAPAEIALLRLHAGGALRG